jgi:hypothetical protein
MTKLTKTGKCIPITINDDVRQQIESFKIRLEQMASQPDETSEYDAETIRIILNDLCDYDRNILIAYYGVADCSPTALGKLLGVSCMVITNKIRKLKEKIIKENNVTKSIYNLPRECIDY